MAKKMYFSFQPQDFNIYDTVSREGELKFKNCDEFDFDDSFFNQLIFVANKKRLKGTIKMKEMVSGTKLVLKIIPRSENPDYVKAYSNRLDLRSAGYIQPESILMCNSAVTGFFNELSQDEELKRSYVDNVVQFFANARAQSNQFKQDQVGPDKKTMKNIRSLSKRI